MHSGSGYKTNSIDGNLTSDRKSTRLNSSHLVISYAVFCLKKKKQQDESPVSSRPGQPPILERSAVFVTMHSDRQHALLNVISYVLTHAPALLVLVCVRCSS